MAKQSKPITISQLALFKLDEPSNAYKKAVQLVHSKPESPLSLLQGKLSNCWLKNALNTEPDADGWWSISTVEMGKAIGFDSNNRAYVKQSARELMKIVFEFDVIAKPNQRVSWKASVLFPDVEINESVIRYQISGQLRERVLNPDMYALIDLNVLRRFQRSSSIPIYEHCIRFVNIGKTADVKLNTFKDIVLGSKSGKESYPLYKEFKKKILRPTIAEINTFSEITIELIEGKVGRKVDSIQFLVTRKKSPVLDVKLTEDVTKISTDLELFGLATVEIRKLVKTNTPNELAAALDYTQKRMTENRTPIGNPLAYFRKALDNKWGIVEAEAPAVPKEKPIEAKAVKSSLEDSFRAHQVKQASGYFAELELAAKDDLVARYNDQQSISTLRFKIASKSKSAQTGFFNWLALDTWGASTPTQLLAFAETLLANR